jgi:hypothetical protein
MAQRLRAAELEASLLMGLLEGYERGGGGGYLRGPAVRRRLW